VQEENKTIPTEGPLTEQDLAKFHTRGYIKVRAFTVEDAAEMEATIWHQLEEEGVLEHVPSTWTKYPGQLSRSVRKSRIFREAMTAEFTTAVDQLLGPGRWSPPKDRGGLKYTFPEDREHWDVTNATWHWHGDPLRNVDQLRDIFVFSFLNRVEPEGGGTVLVEGSHHVVCKFFSELTSEQLSIKTRDIRSVFYASHPWLRDLTSDDNSGNRRQRFMEESTDVFGYPLRVVELTGEPGEAYITNMSALHAASFNVLDRPRFMTTKNINQIDETSTPK